MDSYADLLNLNFMYSLRTGNLLTDMMIAVLLPLVSSAVVYVTRTWWPQLVNRLLVYLSNVDCTSASFRTTEDRASIYYSFTLRVALSTYVAKVLQPRFDVAELKYLAIPGKNIHEAASYTDALLRYCFIDAGPAEEVPMELTRDLELKQSHPGEGNEEENKEKEGGGGSGSKKTNRDAVFTLVQHRPSFPKLKKLLQWAVKNNDSKENNSCGGELAPTQAQALAELKAKTESNGDAIQFLLDRALDYYRAEYKEAGISTDRYLYQPLMTRPKPGIGVSGADEEGGSNGAVVCNRYLLRAEKTFNSLFFPDKPRLLQLIDDFEHKTGKYAIPGYRQKLVLLLYGPPGTGKTSLAKAVAAYTHRDLFAISLSRIHTNEELLKYMFSGHVKVKNEKNDYSYHYNHHDSDGSKELDPTKLVYILEDVDATSAVVLKDSEEETTVAREKMSENSKRNKTAKKQKRGEMADSLKPSEEEGDSTGNSNATTPKKKTAKNDDEEIEWKEEDGDKNSNDNGLAADEGSTTTNIGSRFTEYEVVAVKGKDAKRTRKLTIDGLTNALNGVLDFPQRIVIMTTNHIEKLHPSLLRPGVVTMKLHMHNFDAACAMAMVEHYFSHTEVRQEQLEELRALVEKASTTTSKADTTVSTDDRSAQETKGFSPAELEQRCAECETIDELLEVLRQGSRVNIF